MKRYNIVKYIEQNWKPLIIGYAITLTFYDLINIFEGIVMKIAIIIAK